MGWAGQQLAVAGHTPRAGLSEAEADVEPVFWADVRGEAAWDALMAFTLPAAGLLLLLDAASWAYFGLVGGRIYLYFEGREPPIYPRLQICQCCRR